MNFNFGNMTVSLRRSGNNCYLRAVHQESPLRSANRAARSHGGKAMRIVQHQKKVCIMENNNVRDCEWDDTVQFFWNANVIYSRFNDWKDNVLYACPPGGIYMVPDPVFLGTYVRNNLEFSDYFSASCPNCGKQLYPYHIDGCPTSERVDLQLSCNECGWKGFVEVKGWHIRSRMLKLTQSEDQSRLEKILIQKPDFKAATINDLIDAAVNTIFSY